MTELKQKLPSEPDEKSSDELEVKLNINLEVGVKYSLDEMLYSAIGKDNPILNKFVVLTKTNVINEKSNLTIQVNSFESFLGKLTSKFDNLAEQVILPEDMDHLKCSCGEGNTYHEYTFEYEVYENQIAISITAVAQRDSKHVEYNFYTNNDDYVNKFEELCEKYSEKLNRQSFNDDSISHIDFEL